MFGRRKSTPPAAPTPADPDARRLARARACWEQALADLANAKATLRNGDDLQGGYLSLQAAVNAMTCVCTLHGEFQFPAHSPNQLAGLCAGFDPIFQEITAPGAALEAVQELNPFAAPPPNGVLREMGRDALGHGTAIVGVVKRYLKANRRQFFKP